MCVEGPNICHRDLEKLEGNGSLGEAWTWSPGESEGPDEPSELPLEGPLCHRDSPAPRSPPGLMTMPQILTTSKHTSQCLAGRILASAGPLLVGEPAGSLPQARLQASRLLGAGPPSPLEWREGLPRAGPPWAGEHAIPASPVPPSQPAVFGWTSPGPYTINTNLQGPESQMTVYCVLQRLK